MEQRANSQAEPQRVRVLRSPKHDSDYETCPTVQLCFNADCSQIFAAFSYGSTRIIVWDVVSGDIVKNIRFDSKLCHCVWVNDNNLRNDNLRVNADSAMCDAGGSGTVGGGEWLVAREMARDSTILVSGICGDSGTEHVHEYQRIRQLGGRDALANKLVLSPDGTRLASCASAGLPRIWSVNRSRKGMKH